MRIKKKIFFSLILVFLFSVAVSGGCGGGSSGRYYGNYGQDKNSSQDVTPEPFPENPTSDDDYGANKNGQKVNYFASLNNTAWVIENVSVGDSNVPVGNEDDSFCIVREDTYNYNVNKLKLVIKKDKLSWYDGSNKYHDTTLDPLTVEFFDLGHGNKTLQAPILRALSGFKIDTTSNEIKPDYESYQASYAISGNNANRYSERIEIPKNFNFTKIKIVNYFYIDTVYYWACVELRFFGSSDGREKLNSLAMLNGTKWEIKEFYVGTESYLTAGKKLECYPASSDYNLELTLFTTNDSLTLFDGNYYVKELTIKFIDIQNKEHEAPILRTTNVFKYIKPDDDDEEAEIDEHGFYRAQLPGGSSLGYYNVEYIDLAAEDMNPPDELIIGNDFYTVNEYDNNKVFEYPYNSRITLRRIK